MMIVINKCEISGRRRSLSNPTISRNLPEGGEKNTRNLIISSSHHHLVFNGEGHYEKRS
jgi:hypothetical protein